MNSEEDREKEESIVRKRKNMSKEQIREGDDVDT
jgi:hypothetical protein